MATAARKGATVTTTDTEIDEFLAAWAAAERDGDTAFLADQLTDDFVGVGPWGFELSKEDWIARFAGGCTTSRSRSPTPARGCTATLPS